MEINARLTGLEYEYNKDQWFASPSVFVQLPYRVEDGDEVDRRDEELDFAITSSEFFADLLKTRKQ